MVVITKTLSFQTQGENDIVDISSHVSKAVQETDIQNGTATLFVPGATGALSTI